MFVYLDIVEEFSCKQCGACCRNDWLVTVDEPGYRRNQSLFASQQRSEEFSTAFIPIRSGQEPGEYASIAKNENGACHFLDEQNMCRLQKLGGHEHLDRVCQLFPRYPMDTARGVEISLSFSCPEALRLASRPEPLQILRRNEAPFASQSEDCVRCIYPAQKSWHDWRRCYFEVEEHLIALLQIRSLSLNDRVQLLFDTLGQLNQAEAAEKMETELDRIFRNNDRWFDEPVQPALTGGNSHAEILAENFWVNLLFRKNLYVWNNRQAEQTLREIWQALKGSVTEARQRNELPVLERTIQALELQWNHQARRLGKEGK